MKFSQSPLFALAAATMLSASAFAATTSEGVPNLSAAASSESAAAASTAASDTDSAKSAGSDTDSAAATTQTGTSIQSTTQSITGGSSASSTGTVPTITGGSSATTGGALTGLPSITGGYSIVAPSVPPTADAPYMQSSNLPEGTVFIVVGAVLGFMAMSVLLWRGLVAWSLHRSVKRAAAAQYNPDTKTLFRTPPAPFYKYSDRDSTISLGAIGAKNAKKGSRPPTAPGAAPTGSLFFSPTAAAGPGSHANAGNRGSSYLPAGYYSAGVAQAGNGQGMTHIGQGHGASISLSNLGPGRDDYARYSTPPDSPPFRPQSSGRHGHAYGASSSTLNLNSHNGEVRAPSAVLDDFFDGENAPPVPGHGRHDSTPRRS